MSEPARFGIGFGGSRANLIEKESTMAISPELEAQILRYYHAEKWRMGTIANQLHVHHATVKRVLMSDGVPAAVLRASRHLPQSQYLA